MDINNKNNTGQEKVVTVGRLMEYVDWLNETNGGSMLSVTSGTSGSKKTLTIQSMLENGNGTIYWNRTDSVSTASLSGEGSITVTGGTSTYPKGKFYLEYDGTRYLTLDNSNTSSYNGYEYMNFDTAGDDEYEKCVTYHEITSSTYTRYFDETTLKDGLVVNSYSVGDGQIDYSNNQQVVEKDINFGKIQYELEISDITVEIDAMTDSEEYRQGVIPGSNETPFVTVYNVTDGKKERLYNFSISNDIADNGSEGGKTYTGMTIQKNGYVAKASKVMSGTNEAYKVDVSYYTDSGYTLTSQTVSTRVGTPITSNITTSNHTFSGTSTYDSSSANSRVAKVTIASNGEVMFWIKQRKEIYGYFPVDTYREGSSLFSVDENGNIALSAVSQFRIASKYTTANNYSSVLEHSYGWLSNAGDNFGANSLSVGKYSLGSDNVSAYEAELIREGFSDSERKEICGKDVYNANTVLYNRGVSVGEDEDGYAYHIAYANDVYGSNENIGGFSGTTHLFIDRGYLRPNTPSYSCTDGYMDYTYDAFESEYLYDMFYDRDYYKDCHAYGLTSILRRFRKINNVYVDSAVSVYSDGNSHKRIVSSVVSGSTFPKHISGKTINYSDSIYWANLTLNDENGNGSGYLKSGTHWVSGWTTVFEEGTNGNSPMPTNRNVLLSLKVDENKTYRVSCQRNSDSGTTYTRIAPLFYMVDAESCEGGSSGYNYSFTTSESITDMTGGVSDTRYYQLDDGFTFIDDYFNTQHNYTNTFSYGISDRDDNLRYGVSGKVVKSECCPSAPLQRVSWIDEYAPNDLYGGKIIDDVPANGMAFVDANNEYVGSGVYYPILEHLFVPAPYEWTNGGVDIGLINNFDFSTSTEAERSFAGDTDYTYGHDNSSAKTLRSSIRYAIEDGRQIGYASTGTRTFNEGDEGFRPLYPGMDFRAVDELEFDGTHFTGATYIYCENDYGNVRMRTYTDSSYYKDNYLFGPVEPKFYQGVRPCSGDITIPFWYTRLNFRLKGPFIGNIEDLYDLLLYHYKVYVNGVELTDSGTTSSDIYYQKDNNSDLVHDFTIKGIYGHVEANGTAPRVDEYGVNAIYLTLVLVFVDVYSSTFNVRLEYESRGTDGQVLCWDINGRPETQVPIEYLISLSDENWGGYKDNESNYYIPDSKYGFACIGGDDGKGFTVKSLYNDSDSGTNQCNQTFKLSTRLPESSEVSDGEWW